MLYDPKWEVKTRPDIHAISTLIAWLEKKPAAHEYDFRNCKGECLLGQYWAAHGIEWVPGRYAALQNEGGNSWGMEIAAPSPKTFGAALARARELQALAEEA